VINLYLQYQHIYSDPVEISFISYYKLYYKNQSTSDFDFSKLYFTDLTTYFIT